MLADPRARTLVDNFAGQWLLLRQLETVSPSTKAFDGNLRYSFKRETELLFETILREDRSVLDLIDADYTFVDERLARHYGIPNIRGSRFRRVTLDDDGPARAARSRQSPDGHVGWKPHLPVKRGKWILENLLGAPVPLPPPGVETNLEETAGAAGSGPTSLRQRLEQHRANPSCASCHAVMDPIGFSLENFDLVGAWRDARWRDAGERRGHGSRMAPQLDGPASLRQALVGRREAVVGDDNREAADLCAGQNGSNHFDMPAVRSVVRDAGRTITASRRSWSGSSRACRSR